MRTLVQTLQDHDPGYLRIVAELWGIELAAAAGADQLALEMRQRLPELALPEPAQRALDALLAAGGRQSWEQLNRRFGPLREMGAGRRDRTKPWRDPSSALEMLWYRALVGRAFGDSPAGPLEYGFIPSDLFASLPAPESASAAPLGAPAAAPRKRVAASSLAVDDAATLLAGLRRSAVGDSPESLRAYLLQPNSQELLRALVGDLPQRPERLKRFLTAGRGEALAWLQRAWLESREWNDLAQAGDLQVSGSEWPNDPVGGRRAALELLEQVPLDRWWSLPDFLGAVQERQPNFLRGPGGFDSWYLQRASDGQFLSGFAHWPAVEGAFLRFLIRGPLHWLGGIDLGADGQAFRVRSGAGPLFGAQQPPQIEEPAGAAELRPDGAIRIARSADRSTRYQIARFTRWERADRGGYRYRLSAGALRQAERQGLTAGHAMRVLEQATGGTLPAGPRRALERWERRGQEAALLRELVLQVEDSEILDRLAEQASTGRYLQTRLGPDRAVVLEADWPKLAGAALALGLLIGEPESS